MALGIEIDRNQHVSIYIQIAEQIKTQISRGVLPAGTRLPTIRRLAQQLGVTRLTTHNAYSELQAEGWIESVVGRGTFVSQAVKPGALVEGAEAYLTVDSILSDRLRNPAPVGIRSMAMAHPDENTFPVDEFWASIGQVKAEGASVFQYNHSYGDPGLRTELAQFLLKYDINATPNNIILTNGAMQAISLVGQVLARAGDHVLIDQPSFLGIINAFESFSVTSVPVPLNDGVVDLNRIEDAARKHKPRLYYSIPNFQNPTGYCMPLADRHQLLDLAERYDFYIIEDDIYGELYYDNPPPPRLRALDENQRVIYITSFSKMLMPGLRMGLIEAESPLIDQIARMRRTNDLGNPAFLQLALNNFLQAGGLIRHLKRIRPVYAKRRDTLMQALTEYMPDCVRWTYPQGGFACWVSLPRLFDDGELYQMALSSGFAFTPGEVYRMADDGEMHFRLCFGNQTEPAIRAGVKLLSELIYARYAEVTPLVHTTYQQ